MDHSPSPWPITKGQPHEEKTLRKSDFGFNRLSVPLIQGADPLFQYLRVRTLADRYPLHIYA